MVTDTSAIVAILLNETSAARLVAAVEADRTRFVSAVAVVETSLVLLGRYGEMGDSQLDRLLRALGADVVPVGEDQVVLAREAALRFGRGRHPAALNFGDLLQLRPGRGARPAAVVRGRRFREDRRGGRRVVTHAPSTTTGGPHARHRSDS